MNLLFDQNLSPRLVARLADLFPSSLHVSEIGLDLGEDDAVWTFAKSNGLTIVSKDSDFNDLALLRGFPPKVIWLRTGNCRVLVVETLLRTHHADIIHFEGDPLAGVLALS